MGYGFMGAGNLLGQVNELVWLVVGVLAIVWLWGQVKK
jgi:hypothetical protein